MRVCRDQTKRKRSNSADINRKINRNWCPAPFCPPPAAHRQYWRIPLHHIGCLTCHQLPPPTLPRLRHFTSRPRCSAASHERTNYPTIHATALVAQGEGYACVGSWLDACKAAWLGGCCSRLMQASWPAVVGWLSLYVCAFAGLAYSFFKLPMLTTPSGLFVTQSAHHSAAPANDDSQKCIRTEQALAYLHRGAPVPHTIEV